MAGRIDREKGLGLAWSILNFVAIRQMSYNRFLPTEQFVPAYSILRQALHSLLETSKISNGQHKTNELAE
jgi:hypothetical protein